MATRSELDPILRVLRQHCPLRHPVRVSLRRLPDRKLCGYCMTYINEQQQIVRFAIHLDNKMPYLTTVDTLLHEWAHALDQSIHGVVEEEAHRETWGLSYAQVWRTYVQKCNF